MTEEEARERWCPFSRVIGGEVTRAGQDDPDRNIGISFTKGQPAFNRIGFEGNPSLVATPFGSYCIGSKCMAWLQGNPDDPASGYCGMLHP